MEPRISVLMGVYNCADTLGEALDSLLQQTNKCFKIIMCDDGSTDATLAVAQSYAEKYSNILVLKNEKNIKLAATLNRCLEYANTEYIARMDGDDISLPARFEKQIQFLDEHPEFAVVSSPMIYFDESGDWGTGQVIPEPTIEIFRKKAPHPHAPSMIRTKVMKEVNGYTDNKWTVRMEDYYLWYKIYKAGHKGYNLQQPLYKMRDDKNAMARRKPLDRIKSLLVHFKVGRSLGLPFSFTDGLIVVQVFLKIILPNKVLSIIRKNRLK